MENKHTTAQSLENKVVRKCDQHHDVFMELSDESMKIIHDCNKDSFSATMEGIIQKSIETLDSSKCRPKPHTHKYPPTMYDAEESAKTILDFFGKSYEKDEALPQLIQKIESAWQNND